MNRRLDRRSLLAGAAALAAACRMQAAQAQDGGTILRAAPGALDLPGLPAPGKLDLYGGTLPGPTLRFRQGQPARLTFENALDRPTQLYLQGFRGPAVLDDSVGGQPIAPGERRSVAFTPKDAGTFVYRPEIGTATAGQVESGLAGLLVVDAIEAPTAREHVLALTAIAGERLDPAAGKGAIGWLANGKTLADLPAAPGEKLLLRLANLAAAFPVEVTLPVSAVVLAVDGQPSDPLQSTDGKFLLGPFGRLDFAAELPAKFAEPLPILADFGAGPRPVARFVPDTGSPSLTALLRPAANKLPGAIPLTNAARAEIVIADAAPTGGAKKGQTFLLAGQPPPPALPACLKAAPGRSVALAFVNRTATDFCVHWHGFPARLLDRMDDGWKPWWIDSALVAPSETVRIALVADTTGKWLISAQAIGRPQDRRFTWFEIG